MKRITSLSPHLLVFVVGSVAIVLAWTSSIEVLSQRSLFIAMTMLLLAYLAMELLRLRRTQPHRWLINPVALASILTFGLSFGVTNALFFSPQETIRAVGLVPNVSPAMVKLMALVLLGAMAMWLGYWSPLAKRLSGAGMQRKLAPWIRSSSRPHALAVPLLAAVAFLARLIQVRLGVFGYSSSYNQLISMGGITQYLSMLASLGTVALVLAALTYYWNPCSARFRTILLLMLVIEVAFGFLSGFKSQVAMPFVIVGLCRYLRTGRVPGSWIVLFLVAIVVAYGVIEPFRDARRLDRSTEQRSFGDIAETMASARGTSMPISGNRPPTWVLVLSRSSLTYDGSIGIEYKDVNETLPEGSPKFLTNMILAPAYAWIPRIIWREKPLGDLGLWYTRVVMKRNVLSATASGPVTYLYFAGGALAIFIFFGALGIFQRAYFALLTPSAKPAGALVFLGMLQTLSTVPTAIDGMLVDIFRTLPLLVLLQLLLFRRVERAHEWRIERSRTENE